MAGSLFKHFNEQNSELHGGPLYWGGATGNVPFRGPYAPTLTQDELETQVKTVRDFKAELFDLSDKEQMRRFQWVMDRCLNGWFQLIFSERKLIPEQKTVIVYLEWAQRYGELSPAAKAARSQGYVYSIPQRSPINSGGSSLAGRQPTGL